MAFVRVEKSQACAMLAATTHDAGRALAAVMAVMDVMGGAYSEGRLSASFAP